MVARVQIDSLVRGRFGTSQKSGEMRVFRVQRNGQLCGIDDEGRQHIMDEGNYEVVGAPRPMVARTDIPTRLR